MNGSIVKQIVRKYGEDLTLWTEDSDGEWLDGIWQPGDNETGTIRLHLQPMSDKEIKAQPEAYKSEEWLNFWTLDDIEGKEQFIRDGKIYSIEKFSNWGFYTSGAACRTGENDNLEDE